MPAAASVFAALAIALRFSSDWIFPRGGPFWFQLAQGVLLLAAVLLLRDRSEVFVTGGDPRTGIRQALLAAPLALSAGVALAYARFGQPVWPSLERAAVILGSNLFFPLVEELEFRGFLLGWMLNRGAIAIRAIWVVAALHTLAHAHWFWEGNSIMLVSALLLFVWYGSLTVRNTSLWGAVAAHTCINILAFLPSGGAGLRTP